MSSTSSPKHIGILRVCAPCGTAFVFCLPCDRGHQYCGPECSQKARRASRARSRSRYLRTEQGREKNRGHQKAYRDRQRKLSVSDQSSPPKPTLLQPSQAVPASVPAAPTIREDVPNESEIKVQDPIIRALHERMRCRGCGCVVTHHLSEDDARTVRRQRRFKWLMPRFKPRSDGCSMLNI